ncbi:MAG TPA: CzcE family metal-binding protein [Telluria sp.]|nr:CzcE family metal-binding protein [Telluria sp.]
MLNLGRKLYVALSLVGVAMVMTVNAQAIGLTGTLADYGSVATEQSATRRVVLTDATRYVNVDSGDTVTFVVDGKSFTWNFSTFPTINNFDLSVVAPQGFNARNVRVYVADNPLYRN